MSIVYVYVVDERIMGVSASPQNPMNDIEWIEMEADDPEVLQRMIDHQVRAPYTADTTEGGADCCPDQTLTHGCQRPGQ